MKHRLLATEPRPLASYLAKADQFRDLPTTVLAQIESELQWVELAADEILFTQGEKGDCLYVLVEGRIGITQHRTEKINTDTGGTPFAINELEPGDTLGEIALLFGQPRSATAYALVDSTLARLTKTGFEQLTAEYPQLLSTILETLLPRIQRDQMVGILSDLFGELDVAALHQLQASLTWQHLPKGDVLFRQGDPGDALYIVINGRLQVALKQADGAEHIIGEIGPGEITGELSLLERGVRSATLYAMRETDVVQLPIATFTTLAHQYPQILMEITRHTVKRLREQHVTVAVQPRATTIAIIPIDAAVPLGDFAHHLQHALEKLGRTLHLNSARLDTGYGQPGAAQRPSDHPAASLVTNWLSTQETYFAYILYEADFAWTPWSERCISQADRILLVATAESLPAVAAFEEESWRCARRSHVELVLLHTQPKSSPAHTQRWFAERDLDAYHHIRSFADSHIQRLARRLAGRHIGLVCSGGGARGFMHIGTLRALEELQIEVDVVGGTSIGALVGAAYAQEYSAAEIYELFRPFASRRRLLDYTLPLVSLVSTHKIAELIKGLAGERRIEDLWRPFFAISANISDSIPHVHSQGLLWKALRASMAAIPVFAPMLIDGALHVDGSYMNNFPLDVMDEHYHCHLLIGSDATSQRQQREDYHFGTSISGWQVLWSRLNPFAKPTTVPSIFTLIDQVGFLNSAHHKQQASQLADIMITPERIGEYSSLDFAEYDDLVAMGYTEARRQLISSSVFNR